MKEDKFSQKYIIIVTTSVRLLLSKSRPVSYEEYDRMTRTEVYSKLHQNIVQHAGYYQQEQLETW